MLHSLDRDLSSGRHNLHSEQLGQTFSVLKIYVLAFWLFFDKYWSERSLKEEQRENHNEFFTRTKLCPVYVFSSIRSHTCCGFIKSFHGSFKCYDSFLKLCIKKNRVYCKIEPQHTWRILHSGAKI